MDIVILLPETLARTKKRVDPKTKHNNFTEWFASIQEKEKERIAS